MTRLWQIVNETNRWDSLTNVDPNPFQVYFIKSLLMQSLVVYQRVDIDLRRVCLLDVVVRSQSNGAATLLLVAVA